ncbi:hypothetical protein EW145_g6479 [Phellinidium pouzarii]|uniref:MARVEL domain-containing protein n=1 Tax=Phellinidium pouzarii TaxID=167371 RepID=A0A4S4KWK6_9AGAM|nr:hypothetical protein EW145_g6479 [Phellinidium pouzarii]
MHSTHVGLQSHFNTYFAQPSRPGSSLKDYLLMSVASYVVHRSALYALLWASAVVELGLTGWRIHHTKSVAGFYDPIVAALLVSAVLTLIWIPITSFLHLRKARGLHSDTGAGYAPLHAESGGNIVLWIMWLVDAAIATHKWPTRALVGPSSPKDAHLLLSLVAFAWISFGVLSLACVFVLMHFAALRAIRAAGHTTSEKTGA